MFTDYPKIKQQTQNSRRQKGNMKKFDTEDQHMLDATLQNLVVWATWFPELVHPWHKTVILLFTTVSTVRWGKYLYMSHTE